MPRSLQLLFILLVVTLTVGGPLWYKREYELHNRNFRVVEVGKLYRSGQLDVEGLKRIVHDYGIRTIISLRDGDSALDQEEAEWASKMCIRHVRIAPRAWVEPDGSVAALQNVATFREVMKDRANRPVLIHCFAGIHRTGIYCAIYRMEFQGWSYHDATAEMRALGYATLDDHDDVQAALRQIARAP